MITQKNVYVVSTIFYGSRRCKFVSTLESCMSRMHSVAFSLHVNPLLNLLCKHKLIKIKIFTEFRWHNFTSPRSPVYVCRKV